MDKGDNKDIIKIFYLLTDSDFGGTEASVARLAKGMRQRGYKISICSIKRPGYMHRELSSFGIKVKSLNLPSRISPIYPFFFILAFFRLRWLLKQEKPDILHSFLFQANLLASMIHFFQWGGGRRKIKGFIHSLRCMEEGKPRWRIFLDRWALRRADIVLTVSEAVYRKYLKREKLQAHSMRVVYHGVDPGMFEAQQGKPTDLQKILGICEDDLLIGTVARLHSDKGIEILLEAAALILKSWPKMRVLIVGEGPEKAYLVSLAERLGIMDRVIFAGFRSDVIPWVSLLDIFCLTSRQEGLPQSLIEAMALGKPAVATRVGGVEEEVIRDHICGLLISADDPEALCRAILYLFNNPEDALRMAKAGREMVRQRFLLNQTLDKIEAFYKRYI